MILISLFLFENKFVWVCYECCNNQPLDHIKKSRGSPKKDRILQNQLNIPIPESDKRTPDVSRVLRVQNLHSFSKINCFFMPFIVEINK